MSGLNFSKSKVIFCLVLVVLTFLLTVGRLKAGTNDIKVTPAAIDISAKARDVLHYNLVVNNTGDSLANLYVVLKDWTSSSSEQLSLDELNNTDRTISLSRWLKIRRGVIEIGPKAQVEIPLDVEVNMNAVPGIYHAVIIFSTGTGRSDAEAKAAELMQAQVLLTAQINPEIIEKAQLVEFKTDKNLFLKLPVAIMAEIKNVGNEDVIPIGAIMIYDRSGREVATFPVNEKKMLLAPDINARYSFNWSDNTGFGKYKAVLNLEYGKVSKRDISDTVFFWILPLSYIVIMAVIIIIIFTMFLILLVRIIRPKERSKSTNGVINLR